MRPNTCPEIPACQTLSKVLNISSATARVAPYLFTDLDILSDATVRKSEVDREDLKPCWKLDKRPQFYVINNPIIFKFSQDFINHRKKTNRAVAFSCRPSPNILK